MKTARYIASLLCMALSYSTTLGAYYDPAYYRNAPTPANVHPTYVAVAQMQRMDAPRQPNIMVRDPKHNHRKSSNIEKSQIQYQKKPLAFRGKNLKQPRR